MKNIAILILLISIFLINLSAQTNDEIVASIGSSNISKEEFIFRYEFTPQLMRENPKIKDILKKEFLYSLIAEKLFALYGQSISIDTSAIVRYSLKTFEELFVRDELYRKLVLEKAKPKADSIFDFYLVNGATLKLSYIKSKQKKEIDNIFDLLSKNVPFDSIYIEFDPKEKDTLSLNIGQMDDYAEHELSLLKENSISKPLLIENEYYIFKLIKRNNPLIDKPEGWEKQFKRLMELAKNKAEDEYYRAIMSELFKGRSIKANGIMLKDLANEIFRMFELRKDKSTASNKFILSTNEVAYLDNKLAPEILNSPYIPLDNDSIPLRDFINYFRFEGVSFDTLDYQKVLDVLNAKTKKYIEHKILAREGYKMGLNNSSIVQRNIKLWKDNYLYQLVVSTFKDSSNVTDEEIKQYYNELQNGKFRLKEVNIDEVVTDSLEVAEIILRELENGADIKDLAIRYSIKEDAKLNQGESGFFPVSSKGEIGKLADKMQIGEIYGPLKIPEGYTIFKLIGVKNDTVAKSESFEQIKKELSNELSYLKMKKSMNNFIVNLANKYNVSINFDLLKSISVTNIISVAYNYLGFGGRILAVPLLAPNYDWYPEWQKNRENL